MIGGYEPFPRPGAMAMLHKFVAISRIICAVSSVEGGGLNVSPMLGISSHASSEAVSMELYSSTYCYTDSRQHTNMIIYLGIE